MSELFVNTPHQAVTLNGAIATTPVAGTVETWAVTIAAVSGTQFALPTIGTGQLRLATETAEIILVTAGVTTAGNQNWTVTRGADSTAPTTHGSGAALTAEVTAAALNAIALGTAGPATTVQAESGGAPLSGAVQLHGGSNVTITESGQVISIAAAGGSPTATSTTLGTTVLDVNPLAGNPISLTQNGTTLTWVKSFGAKGDGVELRDVSVTNGSATITSAQAQFTAADVGKPITILGGAGKSMGSGVKTLTFKGTIATVISATSVTLSGPVTGATATNCGAIYGTDDTAAIQAAINAAAVGGGGGVFFGNDIYCHTGLWLGNRVTLRGAGRKATMLFLLHTATGTSITRHQIGTSDPFSVGVAGLGPYLGMTATTVYTAGGTGVMDLTIHGNRAAVAATTSHGIDQTAPGSQGSTEDDFDKIDIFANLYLLGVLSNAMIGAGNSASRWINCHAYYCGNGFNPPFDTYLLDCHAGQIDKFGFSITHPDIHLVQCVAFYCGQNANEAGYYIQNHQGENTLVDCYAQDCYGDGFKLDTVAGGSFRIILSGCTADSCNQRSRLTNTTVSTASIVGATSVVMAAASNFITNDWIRIGNGTNAEYRQITGGAGTTTLSWSGGLLKAHATGEPITIDHVGFRLIGAHHCRLSGCVSMERLSTSPNHIAQQHCAVSLEGDCEGNLIDLVHSGTTSSDSSTGTTYGFDNHNVQTASVVGATTLAITATSTVLSVGDPVRIGSGATAEFRFLSTIDGGTAQVLVTTAATHTLGFATALQYAHATSDQVAHRTVGTPGAFTPVRSAGSATANAITVNNQVSTDLPSAPDAAWTYYPDVYNRGSTAYLTMNPTAARTLTIAAPAAAHAGATLTLVVRNTNATNAITVSLAAAFVPTSALATVAASSVAFATFLCVDGLTWVRQG